MKLSKVKTKNSMNYLSHSFEKLNKRSNENRGHRSMREMSLLSNDST